MRKLAFALLSASTLVSGSALSVVPAAAECRMMSVDQVDPSSGRRLRARVCDGYSQGGGYNYRSPAPQAYYPPPPAYGYGYGPAPVYVERGPGVGGVLAGAVLGGIIGAIAADGIRNAQQQPQQAPAPEEQVPAK